MRATWPSASAPDTSIPTATAGDGVSSRSTPRGAMFSACATTVRDSTPTRPFSSTARTRTRNEPAAKACTTEAPAASSNAPSPSRSHANETPRPGEEADNTTEAPARGAGADSAIDGSGRRPSHIASHPDADGPAPANAGNAATAASTSDAMTTPREMPETVTDTSILLLTKRAKAR
jgi:hypothetical protein